MCLFSSCVSFSSSSPILPPRYNISWAVDSHAPVEEFKLFFRRLPKESNSLGYNANKLDSMSNGNRGASQKYSERLQSLQHQSQQYRNTGSFVGVSKKDRQTDGRIERPNACPLKSLSFDVPSLGTLSSPPTLIVGGVVVLCSQQMLESGIMKLIERIRTNLHRLPHSPLNKRGYRFRSGGGWYDDNPTTTGLFVPLIDSFVYFQHSMESARLIRSTQIWTWTGEQHSPGG